MKFGCEFEHPAFSKILYFSQLNHSKDIINMQFLSDLPVMKQKKDPKKTFRHISGDYRNCREGSYYRLWNGLFFFLN